MTATTNTITVNATTTDKEATTEYASSGIKEYEYKLPMAKFRYWIEKSMLCYK